VFGKQAGNMMNELIGSIIILLGSVFLFLGSIGIVRMPDSYNRIQAGTKATTLGIILTLAGVSVYHPGWIGKMVILIVFVILTNPTSSHVIARTAHLTGVPLSSLTVIDKLKEKRDRETSRKEIQL
jgi:multicomponent Na+:H+ antiporter subunit G